MAEDEMVSGDGWISDESSFYGKCTVQALSITATQKSVEA